MMITMNVKRGFNFHSGPRERLGSLLRLQGNKFCADCGSPSPKWVSLSIGVFICIRCSSVHRSLGTHITKVMSVKLDEWTDEQVDKLEKAGGNVVVNQRYSSYLPDNVKKLKPDSSPDERVDYIKFSSGYAVLGIFPEENVIQIKKYEMLQFPNNGTINDSTASVSLETLLKQESKKCEKLRSGNRSSTNCSYGIGSAFRHSGRKKELDHNKSKINSTSGMIEFVGLIKVNILRGFNLAIRDMISSDPYVVLTLGHQSMKTRVIKSNLNPIWNEKLMLSIPDAIPNLRVQVFDKDFFSADDHMGEAEIDIHPLLTVAKAYENSSISESTQLGKCLASEDNTLVRDSLISLVDGRILQELSLKLKNVECGELDIELECVPLTQ